MNVYSFCHQTSTHRQKAMPRPQSIKQNTRLIAAPVPSATLLALNATRATRNPSGTEKAACDIHIYLHLVSILHHLDMACHTRPLLSGHQPPPVQIHGYLFHSPCMLRVAADPADRLRWREWRHPGSSSTITAPGQCLTRYTTFRPIRQRSICPLGRHARQPVHPYLTRNQHGNGPQARYTRTADAVVRGWLLGRRTGHDAGAKHLPDPT